MGGNAPDKECESHDATAGRTFACCLLDRRLADRLSDTLLILDAWNIAPHSTLRAGIVGIASGMVARMLVRGLHGPGKA
ncbi:hypothetical protein ACQKJZ_10230 [Sphingomonas sp. NPDC019816]|uniref:hypothetical protein n=1 Tax=Sphingomonas sp. NPDC019816 TaxID=3390679 RepID=UPI003D03A482